MPIEQPKRGPGFFGVILILIALVGIAAGVAHFTGKLQPILDLGREQLAKLKSRIPKEEPATKATAPDVEQPAATAAAVPARKATSAEVPARAVAPTSIPERGDPMTAKYKARFKAPRAGSKITLVQTSGSKMTGVLESISSSGVQIKKSNVTMTLSRTQLSPRSRARCYQDEYIAYMIALNKKQAAEEEAMRQQIAKFRAEYESQRATLSSQRGNLGEKTNKSRNTVRGSNAGAGGATTTSRSSGSDMDFKKWMDEHGQSDLLKARKKRIAEYEAQRIREGREY